MAILKNVEHLVTIDTSVAHVAGAIGVPTSVVLPYAPDWRWLLGRSDTPWYKSAKLYRQQKPYEWGGRNRTHCRRFDAGRRRIFFF